MTKKEKNADTLIAENRRARHEYTVIETYEAGVELRGTEVKSLRAHHAGLSEAYAAEKRGELFIFAWHISPYEQGNRFNQDPLRERKLLLHRREIDRICGQIAKQGLTLIPLRAYFKKSRVKLLLGLCRGKKDYDKREDLKKRDSEKMMRQALREGRRRSTDE